MADVQNTLYYSRHVPGITADLDVPQMLYTFHLVEQNVRVKTIFIIPYVQFQYLFTGKGVRTLKQFTKRVTKS